MNTLQDDLALESYDRAEVLAVEIGDGLALASIVNNRGVFHNDRQALSDALTNFKRAERIDIDLGDRRSSAGPLGNQGEVFRKLGQLKDAIRSYDEAERINQKFGNKYWLASNLNGRAMCKRYLGQHHAALADYQNAEAINRELGNRLWLAHNLVNCGVLYTDLELFLEAGQRYSEAEELYDAIGYAQGRAYLSGYRGRILGRYGHYESSLAQIAESVQMNRDLGEREELAENLGNRGRVLFEMGKLREAHESLEDSVRTYKELRVPSPHRFEFTAVLASVEAKLGNSSESARLAREALQLADDFHLHDEHPAKWFARLLPTIREILDGEELLP
jgi:tetratricopeptide (TPR) repeat protein